MKVIDLKVAVLVQDWPAVTLCVISGGLGILWSDESQWSAGYDNTGWCVCFGRLGVAWVRA